MSIFYNKGMESRTQTSSGATTLPAPKGTTELVPLLPQALRTQQDSNHTTLAS